MFFLFNTIPCENYHFYDLRKKSAMHFSRWRPRITLFLLVHVIPIQSVEGQVRNGTSLITSTERDNAAQKNAVKNIHKGFTTKDMPFNIIFSPCHTFANILINTARSEEYQVYYGQLCFTLSWKWKGVLSHNIMCQWRDIKLTRRWVVLYKKKLWRLVKKMCQHYSFIY